ncbi:MAG: glycosyltransferase family 39 protein [Chloroflexia bacterium]
MAISNRADGPRPSLHPTQTWNRISTALGASNRVLWLGALALTVGGVGEALLFSEEWRNLGLALLGLALVVAVIAWGNLRDRPLLLAAEGAGEGIESRRSLILRLAGIALAAGLGLGSVLAYLAAPNALFGAQGVLWLAGMALLVASCARWYPGGTGAATEEPAWTRLEVVFAGLVGLSLVTHVALLQEIPWRFHFDEGIAYTETMSYYHGPAIPMFTTTWVDTGLPSLWFAIAAGWMRLVGPDLAGVRLGVAFIGAVTVIPIYGLARLAWGRLAAGLAGFGVAISAVYVHYSRVSINNVTSAFAWAVCFYFLLKGLRSRRPGDFVWAGLAAGTRMYTYYGTRLLPVLLMAFAGYLLVFHFGAFRERTGHFALLGFAFLVGFGPLIGYFLKNPCMWASRSLSVMNVPPVIPATWEGWVGRMGKRLERPGSAGGPRLPGPERAAGPGQGVLCAVAARARGDAAGAWCGAAGLAVAAAGIVLGAAIGAGGGADRRNPAGRHHYTQLRPLGSGFPGVLPGAGFAPVDMAGGSAEAAPALGAGGGNSALGDFARIGPGGKRLHLPGAIST